MFRLALARSACRRVPATSKWRRLNSNKPSSPTSPSEVLSPLGVKVTHAGEDAATLAESSGAAPPSGQSDLGLGLLTPTDVEAAQAGVPASSLTDSSAGETASKQQQQTTKQGKKRLLTSRESEPFGTLSTVAKKRFDMYDPKQLPFRQLFDPSRREITEKEYAATLVHGRSIHEPYFHPRTHNIPVANLHFRSHDIRLLELFTHFTSHAAWALGIPTSKVAFLPTQRSLWTVIKSPFAHKKSQENFDRKVHKRAIKAWDADPEVVERWIAYLQKHMIGGIGMRVVRWDRMPLGIGRTHLSHVAHEEAPAISAEKIKALGEQIVQQEMSAMSGIRSTSLNSKRP